VQNRLLTATAIAPPDLVPDAMQLVECETRLAIQPRLAGLKHCNRLEQVLARIELQGTGFNEGLMLDLHGNVIEATQGNIFLLQNDCWITPPMNEAGVAGVMREYILREVLPGLGIECRLESVALAQVQACQAMMVCNAVQGIAAVASVTTLAAQRIEFAPNASLDAIQAKVQNSLRGENQAGKGN
ncbi:MAG: hypothetical protein HKO07_07105, partial [Pseudomonadales bacterium]|nr:hypothetical protein [Pseudomonadales bacterium]